MLRKLLLVLGTISIGLTAPTQARELVVATGGGTFEAALRKHFFDGFEKKTGIKLTFVSASPGDRLTKMRAMQDAKAVEWDLTLSTPSNILQNRTLFEEFRCVEIKDLERRALPDSCKEGMGLLFGWTGQPAVYNKEAFKGSAPSRLADYWDVKKFPGARALPNYGGPQEPLAVALMADGVPPDKVFPMDVDRAFRKLDEIKPHVRVWWKTGNQAMQSLQSGEVQFSWLWGSTVGAVRKTGFPLGIIPEGQILDESYWVLIQGAPHRAEVIEFLNYYLDDPQQHVAFARDQATVTPNKAAWEGLTAEERESFGDRTKMLRMEPQWISRNRAALVERWNVWISQ